MTRFSSLLLATSLAVLPISAFAQTSPAKDAAAAGMTTAAPTTTAPVAEKSATTVIQPAKPDVKAAASGVKTEPHTVKTVSAHHAKTTVPAKTVEPAKS